MTPPDGRASEPGGYGAAHVRKRCAASVPRFSHNPIIAMFAERDSSAEGDAVARARAMPRPSRAFIRSVQKLRRKYFAADSEGKRRILRTKQREVETVMGREMTAEECAGIRVFIESCPEEMAEKIWGKP